MLDIFFEGFSWVLSGFYGLVPDYAFAIAMLTVTVYLLTFPLTLKSTRSMLSMARLQPEVARLKKEHKGDSKALMAAQQELFQREGVNPAASCLPTLLQLPLFFILFQVLAGLTQKGAGGRPDPKYLEHGSRLYRDVVADGGELVSFGVDLAKTAMAGPHTSFFAALPFFFLAAVSGVATYFQMKRTQGRNPNAGEGPPGMAAMTKIFPVMATVSALFFPLGLSVYFVMSSLLRIAQQEGMYRWDPHVVGHAKAAAATIETTAIEAKAKPRSKAESPKPKSPKAGSRKSESRQSDPSPAAQNGRNTGRAQPKGTQGRRRKRRKARR